MKKTSRKKVISEVYNKDRVAAYILVLTVVLTLGVLLGYFISNNSDRLINLKPLRGGCNYNGVNYRNGEGFPSDDGCNQCSCSEGKVVCTLMACGPSM